MSAWILCRCAGQHKYLNWMSLLKTISPRTWNTDTRSTYCGFTECSVRMGFSRLFFPIIPIYLYKTHQRVSHIYLSLSRRITHIYTMSVACACYGIIHTLFRMWNIPFLLLCVVGITKGYEPYCFLNAILSSFHAIQSNPNFLKSNLCNYSMDTRSWFLSPSTYAY